ncbi:addiction module protein [Luteolibacter sp. LG18]|uniref:addiction module protein n=1 Tax=Luteolibacter sp. LG18 TaxID=2819286 RepID=UPI002B29CC17|nr:hypothetical protein llg_08400 [Luteolibacter sp. LG18]
MVIAAESYADFEREALMLPKEERSRLAGLLLDSLDQEDGLGLSPEWLEEIHSRVEAIDRGQVNLVSHEEVMKRFAAKIQPREADA